MTNKENLKNEVVKFKSDQEQLKQKVISFVQDKSISLEDRWEVFVDSDLGDSSRWISAYGPFDGSKDADEFYFNRHQVVDMVDLVNMLIENNAANCGVIRTLDEINEIKEGMLQKFEQRFVYDW